MLKVTVKGAVPEVGSAVSVAACACTGSGGALAAAVGQIATVVVVVAGMLFEAGTVVPVGVLAAMAEVVGVVRAVTVGPETLVVPGERVAVVVGGAVSGHPVVAVLATVPDVVREAAVAFEVAAELRVDPVCAVAPPSSAVDAGRARAAGATPSRDDDAVNALDVVVSAGPTRARPSGVVLDVVVVDAGAVVAGSVRPGLVEGGSASTVVVSTGGLVTAAACSGGTVVGIVGAVKTVVGNVGAVKTVVGAVYTVVGTRSTVVLVVVVGSMLVEAEPVPGASTWALAIMGDKLNASRRAKPTAQRNIVRVNLRRTPLR